MRIISGKYRGKRLNAPTSLPVRPTTDFAKEALFNLLNNYFNLDAISALDLFAGTGNISFELGSRGCEDITSVDSNSGCINFISSSAAGMNMPIQVLRRDVLQFLQKSYKQYDFIFADPPYEFADKDKVVEMVLDNKWLSEEGLFILEHGAANSFDHVPGFIELRKYGSVHFSLFENPSKE